MSRFGPCATSLDVRRLVASLIGRLGSSTLNLSTPSVSMSLAGSCFSSELAPGPSIMGSEDQAEQSIGPLAVVINGRSKRPSELTSSIVPRGTSFHRGVELEFPPIGFDPVRLSCCYRGLFPCPAELGAVNPDNGMDRPRSSGVNGNAAEAQLICKKEPAMTDIAMHNDRIATIGMDLGKRSFHLIGMDARGKVIMRQQLSRGRFEQHMANLQPCLVGVEAGAGAHHIGRRLSAFGHSVRLIPGQYVKPFRKGQKNDYRDAEAIAEAVQRPTMRFVPIKSAEQLDLQALHRILAAGSSVIALRSLTSFAASFSSVALSCRKDLQGCARYCHRC